MSDEQNVINPKEIHLIVDQPKNKSVLKITKDFAITFTHPKPNWWWRFWHRVFFGFVWEDYSE